MSTPGLIGHFTNDEMTEWEAVYLGYDAYPWSTGQSLLENYLLFYKGHMNLMIERIVREKTRGFDSIASAALPLPSMPSLFEAEYESNQFLYFLKDTEQFKLVREHSGISQFKNFNDRNTVLALSNLAPRANRRFGPSPVPLRRDSSDDDFWATHESEEGGASYSFLIEEGNENKLHVYGGWPMEYPMFSFSMEEWVDVSSLEAKYHGDE